MGGRILLPGQSPAQMQAEAIRQELAMGRLALRVLAVLLSREKERKVRIKKEVWPKLQEKYPGAVIRFGETADAMEARLATPEDLDELDRQKAKHDAARRETAEAAVAIPEGDGEANGGD